VNRIVKLERAIPRESPLPLGATNLQLLF